MRINLLPNIFMLAGFVLNFLLFSFLLQEANMLKWPLSAILVFFAMEALRCFVWFTIKILIRFVESPDDDTNAYP